MANSAYFVEWKEDFVCQERGSRVVHYILKDSCGESVRAVIGTERSLRHMVYVVAEEFLDYSGSDNLLQPGFKWRSRREVVDWLTSMLAKQHQSDSPINDTTESLGSSDLLSPSHFSLADKMDHRVRNLKQTFSDIMWLGSPWTCGKQLIHYPAFCRTGITIAVQSFVFVMAKEGNHYVAYLEDMYEDKKGQMKVRVRWFHHSQEVKGVVRLRNAHPKEVYITPYTQVISVECVDGPAIVLTREHFEKCLETFPGGLLGKVHLCIRQFKSNKIKPFDLSKLRGYFDQAIISCLESDTFPNPDSIYRGLIGDGIKAFRSRENGPRGLKRTRNSEDQESFLAAYTGMNGNGRRKIICAPKNGKSGMYDKRLLSFKNVEGQRWHNQLFKVDDKVELLCQDSGIRGCWFRCTVLQISRKQMKVQYNDLEDHDGCGKLEEWVPAFRLAAADKLGMRCLGRPTIRPCPPTSKMAMEFVVGAPVDAWWSDGWWEGVVTALKDGGADKLQVYLPGENIFLNVPAKDVRVSRDWVGSQWIDVQVKPNILSVLPVETKLPVPVASAPGKDEVDGLAPETKVTEDEEKITAPVSSDNHQEEVFASLKDDINNASDPVDCKNHDDVHVEDVYLGGDTDDQTVGSAENDGQKESKVDTEDMETAPPKDASENLADVDA